MSRINAKSSEKGRLAAFKLAANSNPLTLGGPEKGTLKALELADWIGEDEDKLEVVELMGLMPFKSLNFIYMVNHAKSLYGRLTGATEDEEAEPPQTEPVEPAKADNSTPEAGTVRRPTKRPRIKKAS